MPRHIVLQWVESHPSELLEVLEDKTETLVQKLEERERDAQRALREPVEPAEWPETFQRLAQRPSPRVDGSQDPLLPDGVVAGRGGGEVGPRDRVG